MNKLFTKIASFVLGLGLAVGVGVAVSSKNITEVKATDSIAYTISAKCNTEDTDVTSALSGTGAATYFKTSTDKISSVSATKVYLGKSSSESLKMGASSSKGYLTINLSEAGQIAATKVVVNCGPANDSNQNVEIKLNNASSGTGYLKESYGSEFADHTVNWDGKTKLTSIYIGGAVASKNRFYLKSITVYSSESTAKLNSIDALEGTLEAHVGDKSWNLTTLTPKGTLDDDPGKVVDISDYVELKTDDVPGTELGSKKVTVHVIDLLKTVASKDFDVDGEVIAIPPVPVTHSMADCYTVAKGTNVKFNGVYMGAYGTNPYQGIFFADGEYGIMVYGTSSVPSDWEVGKTVLAISGQTDYYNGLVQIKSASFEATSASVAVPVVYEFTGAETTPAALSRKTSLSGKVTALKNAFESDKDTTVTIDLGGEKSASIFVKKGVFTNAQLAEFKAGFVVDNEVTVTGFLNYYKSGQTIDTAYTPSSFQIIVPTLVKVGTYTAHDYALDFISATDAVCSTPFGEDGHLTGLLAIWTELNTKYSALKDAEKVAFANPDTTDTDIKAAIARYDFICGKYNAGGIVLTEFVEGHIVPTLSLAFTRDYKVQTNTPMIIVICCAVASVTALGILIVIKRRKSSVK